MKAQSELRRCIAESLFESQENSFFKVQLNSEAEEMSDDIKDNLN